MRQPAIGLWSHLQVDAVEHRLDSSNYGIELAPLGSGILLQHIELRLGPPMIVYRHHKDSSNKRNYSNSNSDHEVLTFQFLGQLLRSPSHFLLLLLELPDGLAQLAELRILLYKHNSHQQQYDFNNAK